MKNGAKVLKIREIWNGAKEKNVKLEKGAVTLKNDALDAKIGVDTAVNEPGKGFSKFDKTKNKSTTLPWIGQYCLWSFPGARALM